MAGNRNCKQQTSSPQRRKRPTRYTCSVAKEKRVVDFIKHKNPTCLSLKMSALKGLCLMKQESTWSIECLVCRQRVWSNKELSYDWQEPISMNNSYNIYMVHKLRRHYEKEHSQTPIWNAVPESRFNQQSSQSPPEYFIHQAMRAGGLYGYVPKDKSQGEFIAAFSTRIFNSIQWVRWNAMVAKRLQQLGETRVICSATIESLKAMCVIGLNNIRTKGFLQWASDHTFEQLYNELMLFFVEMGRYKRCEIFGRPQKA